MLAGKREKKERRRELRDMLANTLAYYAQFLPALAHQLTSRIGLHPNHTSRTKRLYWGVLAFVPGCFRCGTVERAGHTRLVHLYNLVRDMQTRSRTDYSHVDILGFAVHICQLWSVRGVGENTLA